MSTDLRTTLDAADSVTNWTGQGKEALNTTVGQYYEPTGSIEDQRSNTDEETYQSVLAGGPYDLSDSTCYLLSKDNLVDSYANGGLQYLIGDGTNTIGYDVGGFDAPGMSLRYYYNAHKLDVSNKAGLSFATYGGTEANLDETNISEAGIGTLHLAKAVGSIANCWVDNLTFHNNDSYALRINGGTVGTPETMADVQGDDETNGWGLINNPLGTQYGFFGPTEWGEPAANADVYFTATDEQWFWIGDNAGGHAIGETHFPFRLVGNATDTIDIKWTGVVIVNTGTRAQFDCSDADVDVMEFTTVGFTNLGTITFPANDASKFADFCIFNNCDQITPSTLDMASPVFNGTTDPNGAIIVTSSTSNMIDATFNSDGSGHAVYITATGTYDFDNWTFNDYGADDTTDAAVFNDSGGEVTINILNGGGTPTVRNSGSPASTTIINNAVTVKIQGVTEGTSCKVIADETVGTITTGDIILEAAADANGEASVSFNYEGAFEPSGLDVIARARMSGLAIAAIQDDNGVFTDETEEANTVTGSPIPLINLLPAVPVVNQDRYLFGHTETYSQLKIVINTAGTGGFTITWQYWDGGAWSNLSDVVDNTNSFSVSGKNTVSWTVPGDWATTTINSQGPYYYVRAAYTAGTVTVVPNAFKCTLDVTRYLPFVQDNTITSDGLTVTAVWTEDTIAQF